MARFFLLVDLRDYFQRDFFSDLGGWGGGGGNRKKRKISSENDLLTGHFQRVYLIFRAFFSFSFFFYFFFK